MVGGYLAGDQTGRDAGSRYRELAGIDEVVYFFVDDFWFKDRGLQ